MEIKLVVEKTDQGLYLVDMVSNRARLAFSDNTSYVYLFVIFILGVVLTTITMFNIKQEREEKQLLKEELER